MWGCCCGRGEKLEQDDNTSRSSQSDAPFIPQTGPPRTKIKNNKKKGNVNYVELEDVEGIKKGKEKLKFKSKGRSGDEHKKLVDETDSDNESLFRTHSVQEFQKITTLEFDEFLMALTWTNDQISELHGYFNFADIHGEGVIGKEELGSMFKLMHVKLKDKRLNKIWFALSPTGKKQNFEQLIQFLRSSNQAYELHSTLKQADQLYVSNLEAKLQVLVKYTGMLTLNGIAAAEKSLSTNVNVETFDSIVQVICVNGKKEGKEALDLAVSMKVLPSKAKDRRNKLEETANQKL